MSWCGFAPIRTAIMRKFIPCQELKHSPLQSQCTEKQFQYFFHYWNVFITKAALFIYSLSLHSIITMPTKPINSTRFNGNAIRRQQQVSLKPGWSSQWPWALVHTPGLSNYLSIRKWAPIVIRWQQLSFALPNYFHWNNFYHYNLPAFEW